MFLSRNLDQNMHKNALFFEKISKIAAALGAPPPNPRVVTPITCHSYFLEGVYSANVITVQKEQKELRNNNNALLLPFISYFKLCAGYLATTLAQISRHRNNYDLLYIISYLSDD